MSRGAVRAALAVFLLGVLAVWLVKPIGDACPDLGQLPAGSQSSSSPSFAPPLTRTCTYTTAEGTQARRRYVPVVDWLILAVVAGVVGTGVGLLGPGRPATERAAGPGRGARPERAPREERAPRAPRPARARRAPRAGAGAGEDAGQESDEDRAAARERERQERARRRAGG